MQRSRSRVGWDGSSAYAKQQFPRWLDGQKSNASRAFFSGPTHRNTEINECGRLLWWKRVFVSPNWCAKNEKLRLEPLGLLHVWFVELSWLGGLEVESVPIPIFFEYPWSRTHLIPIFFFIFQLIVLFPSPWIHIHYTVHAHTASIKIKKTRSPDCGRFAYFLPPVSSTPEKNWQPRFLFPHPVLQNKRTDVVPAVTMSSCSFDLVNMNTENTHATKAVPGLFFPFCFYLFVVLLNVMKIGADPQWYHAIRRKESEKEDPAQTPRC